MLKMQNDKTVHVEISNVENGTFMVKSRFPRMSQVPEGGLIPKTVTYNGVTEHTGSYEGYFDGNHEFPDGQYNGGFVHLEDERGFSVKHRVDRIEINNKFIRFR